MPLVLHSAIRLWPLGYVFAMRSKFFNKLLDCGGQDGLCDLVEGKVVGGALGAVSPGEKQLAVAERDAGGRVDAEKRQHVIDPLGGAFEFREVANGRLVEDEMGAGDGRVRVLASELLVAEGGAVSEARKDFGKGGAVGDFGLGLDADLVHACRVLVVGVALMGDDVAPSVLADAQDLAACLQITCRSVVEGVLLEGSGGLKMEARLV